MTITIDGIEFDDHAYDDRGDVLYLSIGEPQVPAETDATPEGHAVDFDADGNVIGMVLVAVRWLIDRDGELRGHLARRPREPRSSPRSSPQRPDTLLRPRASARAAAAGTATSARAGSPGARPSAPARTRSRSAFCRSSATSRAVITSSRVRPCEAAGAQARVSLIPK